MTPSTSVLKRLDANPAFRLGRANVRRQEAETLKQNGEWTPEAAAQERIAAEIEAGLR